VWPLGDATFGIFTCPITHDVMTDPVVSADGYTYERAAISRWFRASTKSPVTGQTLPHTDLVPNQSVRTLLKTLIEKAEASAAAPPLSDAAGAVDAGPPADGARPGPARQQACGGRCRRRCCRDRWWSSSSSS
ncbi:unnamed protein product, partial [Prorocentrum cordatum]